MGSLSGKAALVTGAGRGIGRAIALRLAADGAFIGVHFGASEAQATEVLSEIREKGGDGFVVGANLVDPKTIAPLFERLDAALAQNGYKSLHILVNNAGIGMRRDLTDITVEEFDRVFAINVRAPVFVTQEAIKRMTRGGRVINISSMVSHNAYGGRVLAYGASKAAVDYLSLSMAASLGANGITVNAVAPGATATDFLGDALGNEQFVARLKSEAAMGDMGRPEDIASAISFLASEDSRWITGDRIRVSGGTLL